MRTGVTRWIVDEISVAGEAGAPWSCWAVRDIPCGSVEYVLAKRVQIVA